jgi:hypothetical protein
MIDAGAEQTTAKKQGTSPRAKGKALKKRRTKSESERRKTEQTSAKKQEPR